MLWFNKVLYYCNNGLWDRPDIFFCAGPSQQIILRQYRVSRKKILDIFWKLTGWYKYSINRLNVQKKLKSIAVSLNFIHYFNQRIQVTKLTILSTAMNLKYSMKYTDLRGWAWVGGGSDIGPLLVLVFPCFTENVVQNGAHLKKRLFLTYFSHFLVTRESYKKSFSTYLTHIHTCILLTLLTFFALPILKKIQIYQVWFLFGVIPGVDSYLCHFGTINK